MQDGHGDGYVKLMSTEEGTCRQHVRLLLPAMSMEIVRKEHCWLHRRVPGTYM